MAARDNTLTNACLRGLPAALLALALLLPAGAIWAQGSAADPEGAAGRRRIVPVVAAHAMAVTANPYATAAAERVLRAGGNAVDAAIAAQFVLNVVEPQSSGIGGGGFLLLHTAEGRVVTLDGREEAPAAATPDMFLGPDGKPLRFFPDRITGGLPVGVPGLLALMATALERYGTLSLADALQPAIALAADGFPVTPRLAAGLRRHAERFAHFPATRAVFFDAAGEPLAEGATLRQSDLAETFRRIARDGPDAFYRGDIGRDVVSAVREAPVNPGRMTRADLARYRAVERAPVVFGYGDTVLYGMGPPSSGAVTTFQLLGLLRVHGAAPEGDPLAPAAVHRFVQAARLAYADRARYLADADWVRVPVDGLLDAGYLGRRAKAIDWAGPPAAVEPGTPPGWTAALPGAFDGPESPSTTHLVTVDAEGAIVSMTTTIEQGFGSAMVVPGRGFLLNNELTDFAARPVDAAGRPVANRPEGGTRPRRTALDAPESLGGKRPRSSMAPTLVLRHGGPWLAIGSPGGSRIIQYVAEVVLRTTDYGLPLQKAIELPHATHLGKYTDLEPALADTPLPAALERLGHRVRLREQTSGLHGVRFAPDGTLHAGVDPRREGKAAGF